MGADALSWCAVTDDGPRPDETEVGSGRAQVLADADRPGGLLLIVDRVRQSYVDLDDPRYLDFDYMRDFADVLDALPPGPLAVTHVGGGAGTLARYVMATRPRSAQVVLEPDARLTELVRARIPFPARSGIRIRAVAGEPGLRAFRPDSVDVVVLDAFLGGRVPAELTAGAFIADAARVLRAGGVFLANIADGPPLGYARRVLATLGQDFGHLLAISDASVLRGRRFGNIVLAASRTPLPEEQVRAAAASAAFPRRVLAGAKLAGFVAGARAFTESDSARSPAPPEHAWRIAD
jgi:SAM-dependent methyltransferase